MNREAGRILVEGVQMIKRHTRPNPQQQIKGGIAEKESTIHASNVMVLTPGGVPAHRLQGRERRRRYPSDAHRAQRPVRR